MIHSCSYYCERPDCIKAQRDELRERLAQLEQKPVPWESFFKRYCPWLEQPEQGGKTGWPAGMLQDDSRELSKALASKPDAKRHAREAAQPEQESFSPEAISSTQAAWKMGYDAAKAEQPEQESVTAIRLLTEQCAALIRERDELQKQVWRYERHGVTCQTYRHKVEQSCAECNVQEKYT